MGAFLAYKIIWYLLKADTFVCQEKHDFDCRIISTVDDLSKHNRQALHMKPNMFIHPTLPNKQQSVLRRDSVMLAACL